MSTAETTTRTEYAVRRRTLTTGEWFTGEFMPHRNRKTAEAAAELWPASSEAHVVSRKVTTTPWKAVTR